jgi:hypothetical protein
MIDKENDFFMNKERIKLIVRNLELLVDSLKAEVYSDTFVYTESEVTERPVLDYDEIYDDENAD